MRSQTLALIRIDEWPRTRDTTSSGTPWTVSDRNREDPLRPVSVLGVGITIVRGSGLRRSRPPARHPVRPRPAEADLRARTRPAAGTGLHRRGRGKLARDRAPGRGVDSQLGFGNAPDGSGRHRARAARASTRGRPSGGRDRDVVRIASRGCRGWRGGRTTHPSRIVAFI